jgi:hypothetical protein
MIGQPVIDICACFDPRPAPLPFSSTCIRCGGSLPWMSFDERHDEIPDPPYDPDWPPPRRLP